MGGKISRQLFESIEKSFRILNCSRRKVKSVQRPGTEAIRNLMLLIPNPFLGLVSSSIMNTDFNIVNFPGLDVDDVPRSAFNRITIPISLACVVMCQTSSTGLLVSQSSKGPFQNIFPTP